MFSSFESDLDAQMFKISIENYNELDIQVQEMKVRRMV